MGFQRALGKNTGFEIRYIGNQNNHIPFNLEYNEIDIYNTSYGSSASFIDEFRKAQANLAANVAAGRGATFAYTGAPGTSPLPIFLAHYNGVSAADAGDPARYAGTQWSNSATIPSLSYYNPNIGTFASTNGTTGLFGNPTFRASSLTAGVPANFWVMNPDVQSAILRTAQHKTKYHTLQLLLTRRLSNGLSLSGNYAYQEQFETVFDSIFRPFVYLRDTGAPPHAFKVTANYELPVGRGRHFGTDMSPWLNGVIGGWAINFTGRVETGRLWDIGDVRLVNMTLEDLQDQFKFYTNPVDGFVYNLPQELIANTIKAFATDATTPTGRPICTGSNAATCGGPDETKPYIAPPSTDRVRGVRRRRLRRTPAVDQGAAVQPLRPQLQEAVSVRGPGQLRPAGRSAQCLQRDQLHFGLLDGDEPGQLSRDHGLRRHQQHLRSGRPHHTAGVPAELVISAEGNTVNARVRTGEPPRDGSGPDSIDCGAGANAGRRATRAGPASAGAILLILIGGGR